MSISWDINITTMLAAVAAGIAFYLVVIRLGDSVKATARELGNAQREITKREARLAFDIPHV